MKTWRRLLVFRPWERHSLVLMVGGLVYIGVGITYMNVDPDFQQRRAWIVALNLFSLDVWAKMFIVAGVLAICSSRWPDFSDRWGYGVLCGLSAGWAATYFLGYFLGGAPASNIGGGVIWAFMSFLWWAISGLVNPSAITVVINDDSD